MHFGKKKVLPSNWTLHYFFLLNNIPLKFGGWDGSGWVLKMGKEGTSSPPAVINTSFTDICP
jgi:hypothetical protein